MKQWVPLLRTFCLAIMSIMFGACSRNATAENLTEAELAVERANYAEARRLTDEAVNSGTLGATGMARASLVYIKLADLDPQADGEDMGLAVNAYNKAMELAPDSAAAFYESNREDPRYVSMLLNLIRGLELPDSAIYADEPISIIDIVE